MNNTTELNTKIAGLESHIDLLETELTYIDQMLLKCGFPEGIKTLKRTVEDLLSDSLIDSQEDEFEAL